MAYRPDNFNTTSVAANVTANRLGVDIHEFALEPEWDAFDLDESTVMALIPEYAQAQR